MTRKALTHPGARPQVDVYDPCFDVKEGRHEYGVKPLRALPGKKYDAAVLAVAHNEFREMGIRKVRKLLKPTSVVYDIKHLFGRHQVDGRL
jgi:UDP-N-acetyl-D-galactosamine dehydrogenase